MAALTADELADLREPVRRLCTERFDRTAVRESGGCAALDRRGWQALAEVGVLGALAPANLGGAELDLTTVSALIEECGYGMASGPLVWACLAATAVAGVASGDRLVSGAIRGQPPILVEHGEATDAILILGDTIELHPTASLRLQGIKSVDPLTSLALVTLPDRADDARQVGDSEVARRWRLIGACLSAAYLVGLARRTLDLGVEHAKNRVQFGRPIGGFQAVKHLLADSVVAIEPAAAAVSQAADELQAHAESAPRSCAAAKVLACESALLAVKNCIQVFGGMGYAWESDPHLVWKRAMIYSLAFGTPDEHAHAIAASLGAR